jgi:hypothetical protein
MNRRFAAIFLALAALGAGADEGPARPGTSVVRAWLVPVADTGRLEVVPGPRPDEAVEALYTVRFRYDGETEVQGLEVVQRVPVGMRYVAGSATGPDAVVTFSVDDGESFDIPEALTVAAGEGEARPAMADDYTHICWQLPGVFPPGVGGVLSFRTRPLEPSAEPANGREGR